MCPWLKPGWFKLRASAVRICMTEGGVNHGWWIALFLVRVFAILFPVCWPTQIRIGAVRPFHAGQLMEHPIVYHYGMVLWVSFLSGVFFCIAFH
jgi:hypothetical protein